MRELALPDALETLLAICRGDPMLCDSGMRTGVDVQSGPGVFRRPTIQQRQKAAKALIAKCLPDLRSVDIAQTVDQTVREEQPLDPRQTARKIFFWRKRQKKMARVFVLGRQGGL